MSANTTISSSSSTFDSTSPSTNPPTTTTNPPPTSSSEPPPTTSSSPPTTTPPPTSSSTTTSSIPPTTTTTISTTSSFTTTTTTTTTSSSPRPTTIPTTDTTVTVTPTSTIPPTTTVTTITESPTTTTTSSSPSATTSGAIVGANGGGSKGLGSSGTIAIAVIIPVVAVALLLVLGFFFWRKRKARKEAEEQRKNEMAEYGYNPNNDPSLFPVGAAYTDGQSEAADDNSGYRGWGTTNSNARKASTTMGSNSRAGAVGLAVSDNISQPSGYAYGSPPVNGPGEPLMRNQEHTDEVAALGGAAGAGGVAAAVRNNRNSETDMHRGVSNASSSYSRGPPLSETSAVSAEDPYTSPQYHEDAPYNVYNDGSNSHGPYGDGTYSNDQPIIRDVSARRNTKIERAPTFPQTQGGIAQNF